MRSLGVSKYFSLVKFSHTIFAMPFALTGMFAATHYYGYNFDYRILILIVLCMIFARNTAMSFNRFVDRKTDAINPRTSNREIPIGIIPPQNALVFAIINIVLFVVSAALINSTCLALSPIALLIILGYSFTKRFTFLSHLVLGIALSVAPFGAFVAVSGDIKTFPFLLSAIVMFWTAGFDIIYSIQDQKFDKENKLHSVPARFGTNKALFISETLHFFVIILVVLAGLIYHLSYLYAIGAFCFIAMLILQHILVNRKKQNKILLAFGVVNGIASCVFGLFAVLDFVVNSGNYPV